MKRLLAGGILAVIVISSLAATGHDQEGTKIIFSASYVVHSVCFKLKASSLCTYSLSMQGV